MPKTVKELNEALLEIIGELESQPTGTKKTVTFPKLYGVEASKKAAIAHSKLLNNYEMKSNFEKLGVEYEIAPALLAGKGSRESGLGSTLHKNVDIYWGWGDYSQRTNEKSKTYHGFGVLQLDRITAPFREVTLELTHSLGRVKLNPYEYRWLEWGIKTFLLKLEQAGDNFPELETAERFATALSKYNGGKKGYYYPDNDKYTTGKDYANDTLVRASWFASNWEEI